MFDDWSEYFILSESDKFLKNISANNDNYYDKHSSLVNELKVQLQHHELVKLLELEELFNEQVLLQAEAFKSGMKRMISAYNNQKTLSR